MIINPYLLLTSKFITMLIPDQNPYANMQPGDSVTTTTTVTRHRNPLGSTTNGASEFIFILFFMGLLSFAFLFFTRTEGASASTASQTTTREVKSAKIRSPYDYE
jgi:hypothetical protein